MLASESCPMASTILLEICVESLDHAVAAESGGADRIELCRDLWCGGTTPSVELMRAVRQQVRIPIHGLIRPRSGDFCYSTHEFETIKRGIDVAKDVGLDGIVLGLLDSFEQIDRERTRELVHAAHPLPVTFHRAFDQCPDLTMALEAVIATGAKRILTSGGKPSVMEALASLASLLGVAKDRIVLMPGGGVRASNVERILRGTGAREIHTSLDASHPKSRATTGCGTKIDPGLPAGLFEERVRRFKCELGKVPLGTSHS
jgi:copper homeostasis protein